MLLDLKIVLAISLKPIPPSGLVNAENVSLVELNLNFIQNGEEINISSHVAPRNSRYGRKLSFHE